MPEYTPEQFAAILLSAAAKTPREAVGIVRKGSVNVERDAKRNVRQTAPVHNAHAANTITFDVAAQGPAVVGEIGYDKELFRSPGKKTGPGGIGNLLEFGGGGDHSPPHHDLSRALAVEEPKFLQAIADMGERVIE